MTARRSGRPRKTEHERTGELLWLEQILEEEKAALRRRGHKPKKALARAAARLEISHRVAWRRLAKMKQNSQKLEIKIAAIGDALLQFHAYLEAQKQSEPV